MIQKYDWIIHIIYIIQYRIIQYITISYFIIQYHMIQYRISWYNIISYSTISFYMIRCNIIHFFLQCQHKSSARSYDDWRFSFSYSLFGHYLSPCCLWTFPWVSSITTRSTRPMWPVNRGCLLLHGTSSFLLFL